MAHSKAKNLEHWGRHKARERYAEGGDVKPLIPLGQLNPQDYLDKLRDAQEKAGAPPGGVGTTTIQIGGRRATSKGN